MHYVKDTKELTEICSKLQKSKILSIDTEFIREKTYWPKLCLIQVYNGFEKIIIELHYLFTTSEIIFVCFYFWFYIKW